MSESEQCITYGLIGYTIGKLQAKADNTDNNVQIDLKDLTTLFVTWQSSEFLRDTMLDFSDIPNILHTFKTNMWDQTDMKIDTVI